VRALLAALAEGAKIFRLQFAAASSRSVVQSGTPVAPQIVVLTKVAWPHVHAISAVWQATVAEVSVTMLPTHLSANLSIVPPSPVRTQPSFASAFPIAAVNFVWVAITGEGKGRGGC